MGVYADQLGRGALDALVQRALHLAQARGLLDIIKTALETGLRTPGHRRLATSSSQ